MQIPNILVIAVTLSNIYDNMRKKEAIFKVAIDYPHNLRKDGARLSQSNANQNFETKLPSFRRVQEIASRVILQELPNEVSEIYDIKIKTRIVAEREGSFVVYFGVILTAYSLIGGYSSFFTSLELIKEHTNTLLDRAFGAEFSEGMNIVVNLKTPDRDYRRRRIGHKEMDLFFDEYLDVGFPEPRQNRKLLAGKGFFLYLLCTNIVLLAIVGIIAYKAIMSVYFGISQ